MQLLLSREPPAGESFVLPDDEPLLQWIKRIRSAGIVKGLDLDRIKDLHGMSMKPDGFHIVAQGEEPQHERYHLTLHVQAMKISNPQDGVVNFRERGYGVDVVAGQILAEYHAEGPGKEGFNIKGQRLPFQSEGTAVSLKGNSNVAIEKDGLLTKYIARIDGVLDNSDLTRLEVNPELVLRGGLNYETGDVQTRCPIIIEGDVRAGFSARSGSYIQVSGAVEKGSVLDAGGDITIEGGVATGVSISSGGDVRLRFAQGTIIVAKGEVHVEQYLFDCTLRVQGKLLAHGKGRSDRGSIVGGSLNAVGGMEIESVGSAANITALAVGVDLDLEAEIEQLIKENEKSLSEMKRQIRMLPVNILVEGWKEQLAKLPVDQKSACLQRIQRVATLKQECANIKENLAVLQERKAGIVGADRLIIGLLVPDVEIRIGDLKTRVTQKQSNVTWCLKSDRLVVNP